MIEENRRNTNLDLKEHFILKDLPCKNMFTGDFKNEY